MVDITKLDMTNIWASGGDKVDPGATKTNTGWQVEVVPRQTWNWMQNRVDQNIAYILQKGFPEWDNTTEYQTNKSYVQRNNIVYKCIQTSVAQDPQTATAYWVRAFATYTNGLDVFSSVTPDVNALPYFPTATTVATTVLTPFARTLLDDADSSAARTTLAAQQLNANLTGLSSVSGATNNLPYFTGSGGMTTTVLTAFARSFLDDGDAASVRATLGLGNVATLNIGTVTGTVAAGDDNRIVNALQNSNNLSDLVSAPAARTNLGLGNTATLNVGTGAGTVAAGDDSRITGAAQKSANLSDLTNVTTARSNLGLGNVNNTSDANKPVSTAQQTALDGKQPLDATLTALAGLINAADQIPYFTGVDTLAATSLTTFSRGLLGNADAAAWKNSLNFVSQTAQIGAAVVPSGATASRPASPSAGMFRYNSDTNQFEGYQNGSWGDIGGGAAVFSVQWWPGTRASIPGGYLPADGQTPSRAVFPTAWSKIAAGEVPTVTDAAWLSTNTNRGNFTTGDGSTTFRLPDYNGQSSGSYGALMMKGDGVLSAGTIGAIQADDIKSHSHLQNQGIASTTAAPAAGSAVVGTTNTSSTNPTGGTETRVKNVTGVWIIKLAGAGINTGTVDVTALATNAYQKNNILGVVSQTSGTPTGAIIERGSNANGEYVKYADGTMIAWRSLVGVSVGTTTAYGLAGGSIYYGNLSWPFPVAFSATPVTNHFVRGAGKVCWVGGGVVTTSSGGYFFVNNTSETIASCDIYSIAIGRWY